VFLITGIHLLKCVYRFFKCSSIPLDITPGRKTVRVVLSPGQHLDFTDLQGKNIEEDLSQRDFTINAMGQLLSDFLSGGKPLIDPFNGEEDVKVRKIRVLQGPAFESDPLRMLRAFRFAATLGFNIDEETLAKISLHKSRIIEPAPERIWQELALFFKAQNTFTSLEIMHSCGLLDNLVFAHDVFFTKSPYQNLENHLNNPESFFPEYLEKLRASKIFENQYLLKISALLKGAGSSELTRDSSKRRQSLNLRASNAEITFMKQTISGFQYLTKVYLRKSIELHDSELYDLVNKVNGGLPAPVFLFLSQYESFAGVAFCSQILEFYFNRFLPVISEKPLLNGNDIIHNFRLSPSPLFGKILQNIRKAQVLGHISTRDDAIGLAENLIKTK